MGKELTNVQMDYFAAYAAATRMSNSNIAGTLLRYVKGVFIIGKGENEMPLKSKLVFNMPSFLLGWQRWENKRPVEQLMGLLYDGFKPIPKDALSHRDEAEWEPGPDGKASDPWQFTNQVVCTKGRDVYTFTTSSSGGIKALGILCDEYSNEGRQRPKMLPIVEVGSSSYKHNDWGKVPTPTFAIVGWSAETSADMPEVRKKIATRRA